MAWHKPEFKRIPEITNGLGGMLDVKFYFDVPDGLRAIIRQELEKLRDLDPLGDGGYSRREVIVYSGQPRYCVVDVLEDSLLGTSETGSRVISSEEIANLT